MGLLQGLEQAGSQPVAHQKQGCIVPGKLRISFSRLLSKAYGAISYGIGFSPSLLYNLYMYFFLKDLHRKILCVTT